jgi:hypothetical protein
MFAPPEISRNAEGAQCEGRAKEGRPKSAAKGIIEAEAPKDIPARFPLLI